MTRRRLDAPVPPPPELQQRAWEYARALDTLPQHAPFEQQAAWFKARNHWPADLTWRDCRDLFRLHRSVHTWKR